MSNKKKLFMIICAVFVTAVVSFSIISYSIAKKESERLKDNSIGNVSTALESLGANSGNLGNMEYISNIDLLIENSNKGIALNIVEIFPDTEYTETSDLATYISSGDFKKYVIDANGTKKDADGNKLTMADNMINYKAISVSGTTDLTTDTDLSATLGAADLIYISSQSYNSYDGKMSESVYNFLHSYALGTGTNAEKPIIIDYHTSSSSSGSSSNEKTYKTYVNDVSQNYIRYRTFYWNTAVSVEDFFAANGDSYYIPFNVNSNKATGNVLVISSDGKASKTDGTISKAWIDYGNSSVISKAYYGLNSKRPSKITYTDVTASSLTTNALSVTDFVYDFVIIENDVMATAISNDVYTALKKLSISSKYIIYDKANLSASGTSGESQVVGNNLYRQLVDLLVYNTGNAKVSNALPVSHEFFATLIAAGSDGLDSAKLVANLLDGANYRGSNTSGAKGKVFRVLELQPCYPIDLEVALANGDMDNTVAKDFGLEGNYYTDPYNVLNGVSKDEVTEGQEYYKFTLSVAKIAYATGLKPSQIQIDQMSTEEFITTKDLVLETYDLIYIGGDKSAMMPTAFKNCFATLNSNVNSVAAAAAFKHTTSFEMYTHTGNIVTLKTYASNSGLFGNNYGGTVAPYGSIKDSNGTYITTTTVTNGNDLTEDKKNDLLNYIKAGYPVVFGSDVTSAFQAVCDKSRMEQLSARDIDPDSQMYKLLSAVYNDYRKNETVVWGADISEDSEQSVNNFYYVNSDGSIVAESEDTSAELVENAYGSSLSSKVTVFSNDTNKKIKDVINSAQARPTLVIEAQPKDYSASDATSYNENTGTMTVNAKVNAVSDAKNYVLELYVDYDGDGLFDTDELKDSADFNVDTDLTAKSLTYTLTDGFVGLVSWKVIAKESVTGNTVASCSSTTGYAYFKSADNTKKEINVLEIMPISKANRDKRNDSNYGKDGGTGSTLYLCTECQHALHLCDYNLQIDGQWNGGATYNNVWGTSETSKVGDMKMGLHEHTFGIVRHDMTKTPISGAETAGSEDWDYNYADEPIIKDNYEINIDIMYSDEFENYVQTIKDQTNSDGTSKVATNADGTEMEVTNADGTTSKITWQEYYEAEAEKRLEEWTEAQASAALASTKKNLVQVLKQFVEDNPDNDFTQEDIDNEEYYEFFMKNPDYYSNTNVYKTAYVAYVEQKDIEIKAHEAYKEACLYACTSSTWLSSNYDMIVLGFAEDFGASDFDNEQSCTDLKSYIKNDGNLLTTHDSTTKYANAGSINFTDGMREVFGMDRYHMTLDDTISAVGDVTVENVMNTIVGFQVGDYDVYGQEDLMLNGKDLSVEISLPNSSSTTNIYNRNVKPIDSAISQDTASGTDGKCVVSLKLTSSTGLSPAKVYPIIKYNNQYYISKDELKIGYDNVFVLNTNATDTLSLNNEEMFLGLTIDSSRTVQNSSGVTTFGLIDAGNNVVKGYDLSCSRMYDNGYKYATYISNESQEIPTDALKDTVPTVSLLTVNSSNTYVSAGEMTYDSENDVYVCEVSAQSTDTTTINAGNSNLKYLKYKTTSNYDSSKYYYTEWSIYGSETRELREKWQAKVRNENDMYDDAFNNVGLFNPVGITDSVCIFQTDTNNTSPYKYAEYNMQEAIHYNQGVKIDTNYGTDRASQVNDGIITTYPFNINQELVISGTHAQTFALDLEDSNVTVWYTLAAGTSTYKGATSLYAATPHDGMDNYFLYSKGNIFYCGAGHTIVTGPDRNNNDERMLYINVIVNSARNKAGKPVITLYNKCDESGHTDCDDNKVTSKKSEMGQLYIAADGEYECVVDSKTAIPEFDFKVTSQKEIKKVKVYYDLNYGKESSTTVADVDILEHLNYISGTRTRLREDEKTYPNLPLKPEYFTNNYAYIVVVATDSSGKMALKRVRIKYIDELFDLTDATLKQNVAKDKDSIVELDITDRIKFHI